MHDKALAQLRHQLTALSAVLKKAETHCEARKIDHQAILAFRLFPDMLPFARQVQIACDFAKGAAARLAGEAVPSYADDEKSFAELQARIAKTLTFMDSVAKERYKESASRQVTIKTGGQERTMSGEDYFNSFVLPNFYFHATVAYSILRHNGIELGKGDFLGRG
jgi:hypothetical protein